MGPPELDRRAVGGPDPRGLVGPLGLVAGHRAGDARADGRRQHVPQPGPDGEARHDPRPPVGRPRDARPRRRLVRTRARRLRDRLRQRLRRAARPAGRGDDAGAPPARRRAGHARRADLPDARRAGDAAAGAGAAADHDRRVGAEEDAADAGPVRRPVELDGHGRQARASATRSCASTARRSAATTRRSSGRPRVDIVIRDTHEAGLAYYRAQLAADGEEFDPDWNFFVGPPAEIAEGLQPILELGLPPRARSTCPRRTTSRRSDGSASWSSCSTRDGVARRRAGRRGRRRQARGRPRRAPRRSAVGGRQHGRRLRAARPAGDAGPRHRALQPGRDRAGRVGLGHRGRHPRDDGAAGRVRRARLVLAGRP